MWNKDGKMRYIYTVMLMLGVTVFGRYAAADCTPDPKGSGKYDHHCSWWHRVGGNPKTDMKITTVVWADSPGLAEATVRGAYRLANIAAPADAQYTVWSIMCFYVPPGQRLPGYGGEK